MTPGEILARLADPDSPTYPREAVDAALAQRDAVVPILLDAIRDVLADPAILETADDLLLFYACLLFGYFREQRAHVLLLDLFRRPQDDLDYFEDMVTEDLPCIFHRTSGGDGSGLMELARDGGVSIWVRMAALTALVLLVADGSLTRDQVCTFLDELLTENPDDTDLWSEVAALAYDMQPRELLPRLREGFESGLIQPWVSSWEELEAAAEESPELRLQRFLKTDANRHPDDFHSWVSWHGFYGRSEPLAQLRDLYGLPAPQHRRPVRPKRKKTKSRRKQARKSRRRNRRKK